MDSVSDVSMILFDLSNIDQKLVDVVLVSDGQFR